MAALFAIFFTLFLNIPRLILIIMGIVFIKDKKPVGKLSAENVRVIGIILVVFGLIWTVNGLFAFYGIQ